MAYIYTNIVGMRFLKLPASFLSAIDVEKSVLVREPTNPHDPHAIKCIFDGIHFGYIEKKKSENLGYRLASCGSYAIRLIESGGNYYSIRITFKSKTKASGNYTGASSKSKNNGIGAWENPSTNPSSPHKSTVLNEKIRPTRALGTELAKAGVKDKDVDSKSEARKTPVKQEEDSTDSASWMVWLILGLVVFVFFLK